MGLVIRPFNYEAGNTILAEFHNSNEITLYNLVNGNLSSDNFALGALAESAITFADDGHEHGGGTDGSVINHSKAPAGSDTFLMRLISTGAGHGIEVGANDTGYAGIKAIGNASDAFGATIDQTVTGGTALNVTDSGANADPVALITGGAGASAGDALHIVHATTNSTQKSALEIDMSADTNLHYGINIETDVEGSALRVIKKDAVTDVVTPVIYIENQKTSYTGNLINIIDDVAATFACDTIQITKGKGAALRIVKDDSNTAAIDIDISTAGVNADAILIAGDASNDQTGLDLNECGITIDRSLTGARAIKIDMTGSGNDNAAIEIDVDNQPAILANIGSSQDRAGVYILATNGATTTTDPPLLVERTGMSATAGNLKSHEWVALIDNVSDGSADANCLYVGGLLYGQGDHESAGAKNFLNPHPLDSTKAIKYTCLEGPENGIFWRSRVTMPPGMCAYLEVPDYVYLAQAEEDELDVICTSNKLCQCAGYHDVENKRIVITTDMAGVEVSVMCLGTRRYFEDHEHFKVHDWSDERGKVGTAAYRAYGPE
jgi:hypothetical protein